MIRKIKTFLKELPNLLTREIWVVSDVSLSHFNAKLYALLRVVYITIHGVIETKIANRAAALSYFSLISLGPLIAIVIMISGFIFKEKDEDFTLQALNKLIHFISPPSAQLSEIEMQQNRILPNGDLVYTSSDKALSSEAILWNAYKGVDAKKGSFDEAYIYLDAFPMQETYTKAIFEKILIDYDRDNLVYFRSDLLTYDFEPACKIDILSDAVHACTQTDSTGPSSLKDSDANFLSENALTSSNPHSVDESTVESQQESVSNSEWENKSDMPIFNPQLVQLINDLIKSARSGTAGFFGTLVLVLISIQLISNIEKTFNMIWGVRRGRSWVQRLVSYWTLISLGAVAFFALFASLSTPKAMKWVNSLPYASHFLFLGVYIMPLFSFLVITLSLAFFYRFIPNTTVKWRPAFLGAFIVTLLLTANNYLSFLYIGQVLRSQSLYGSIGIFPVLMFGLFIFWLFILLGGQITYSIQNANFLTNQKAWDNISFSTREILNLSSFLIVARRFQNCFPPLTSDELSEMIRVPSQILNESLVQLCDMKLLNPIESVEDDDQHMVRYQPAMPLEKISLGQIKLRIEEFGNSEGTYLILSADPIIQVYRRKLTQIYTHEEFSQNIADLLKAYPKLYH